MKHVQTADGSATLFSPHFKQYYHSLSGAKEEAVKKYVEPCKIAERDSISILDVCFGLGYNSAAAIDASKPNAPVIVYALENDVNVLRAIGSINYPFVCRSLMLNAVIKGYAKEGNKEVHVLIGDACETIAKVPIKADVVFFDPFSIAMCPKLWTVEFFIVVFNAMKPDGILSTYSCARAVRENMRAAGFKVLDGPTVKRRGPGTLGVRV